MNIELLANWGEFIGGIAVVAGLFFVGLQLAISNREARETANQNYAEFTASIGLNLAIDGGLADIFVRGADGLDNLDGAERLRYMAYIVNGTFRFFENLYSQNQAGRIDSATWESTEAQLRTMLGAKGVRDAWALRKDWFTLQFRTYIDALTVNNEQTGRLSESYRR